MKRTLPALASIAIVSLLPGLALAAPHAPRPKADAVFGPVQAVDFRPLERTERRERPRKVKVTKARIGPNGLVVAPPTAPPEVVKIIKAGNEIATTPYVYGGGHGSWAASGYDCSGSVSYALHGAGFLDVALDSSGLAAFGKPAPAAGCRSWATPSTPTWWSPVCASTQAPASRPATAGPLNRAPRAVMRCGIPQVSEVGG